MPPDLGAARWPPGIRVTVRGERTHPGARLTFRDIHGYRFQTFATTAPHSGRPVWIQRTYQQHMLPTRSARTL